MLRRGLAAFRPTGLPSWAASLRRVNEAPPSEVSQAAHARAAARAAGDWAEADRLKALIEAAGWKIVDRGTHFALSLAGPRDVVESGRVRYGRSDAVPSRLAEPATAAATLVTRATDAPDDLARLLSSLRRFAPEATQVVIVADAPSPEQASDLEAADRPAAEPIGGLAPEIVWTVERLGLAGAANAGLRRAVGRTVVLVDPSVEPTGDIVTPLVRVLDDSSVAVVGDLGATSADLRRFAEAPPGDVDTIDGTLMAFRREDFPSRGPLDERFRTGRYLDTWWSFVLRDEGDDDPTEPRRAVRVDGLPLVRHDRRIDPSIPEEQRARLDKRAFYRFIERFGGRGDLLVANQEARRPPEG
jgi:glycosyl transferase family 2